MNLKMVLDQMANGLVLGSMYALYACGVTLIWGTMRMLNFAHGEYYMLGGYILYFATTLLHVPPVVGVLIAVGGGFLLGVMSERVILHPLLNKPGWDVSPFVATMGVSIFLQNFALKVWGERYKNVPYFVEGTMDLLGLRIAYQRILILVVAVVVISAFMLFIKRSRFGMALRATSQNREAAFLVGINIYRVYMVTFGIGGMLAALAAAMLTPIYLINPWMGLPTLTKAFVVSVLGGLGSLEGAILAGVILGMGESLVVVVFSSEWKEVFSFLILIVVLATRPSGFFGEKLT
jgi:branched-chain amino acid transport system permease protein